MKKIFYSIGIALVAMVAVSCEEFLTEHPKTEVSAETVFSTRSGCEQAVKSVYYIFTRNKINGGAITGYGITPAAQTHSITLEEYTSDDMRVRNTTSIGDVEWDEWTFNESSEDVGAMYYGFFVGIKECNTVIKGVKISEIDDEDFLKQIEGEARGVRAWLYFKLVRDYGATCIVTEETDLTEKITRQPIADVYKLIISDLEFAAKVLPNRHPSEGAGRFSKAAAEMALSQVYLTMSGRQFDDVSQAFGLTKKQMCEKSAQYAKDVLNMSEYELFHDYRLLFQVPGNNCNESVFEVISDASRAPNQTYPSASKDYLDAKCKTKFVGDIAVAEDGTKREITGGGGKVSISDPLMELFNQEPNDKRFRTIIPVYYKDPDKNPVKAYGTNKWCDTTNVSDKVNQSKVHYKVLRLAEAYLLYAEAANEAEGGPSAAAKEALMTVRRRVGITTAAPDGYEAFREAVWNERRKELYFESGIRLHDLQRTGKLLEMVQATPSGATNKVYPKLEEKHWYFPIPYVAYQLNPYLGENNKGWHTPDVSEFVNETSE